MDGDELADVAGTAAGDVPMAVVEASLLLIIEFPDPATGVGVEALAPPAITVTASAVIVTTAALEL